MASVVLDLFDDARTELALEELRTAERVVVGVGIVAVGVLVGVVRRSLTGVPRGPGVLDRAARGGDGLPGRPDDGGPPPAGAADRVGRSGCGCSDRGAGDRERRLRPGWADGSTIALMRQSWPITSIAACRRISSLPPLVNELRAPALTSATVIVLSSTAATWPFWLSRIQV